MVAESVDKRNLKTSVRQALKWGAPISGFLGILSDLAAPLGSIAVYLACIFAVGMIVLLTPAFLSHRMHGLGGFAGNRTTVPGMFCAVGLIFMVGVIMISEDEPESGFLASRLSVLAEMQSKIFGGIEDLAKKQEEMLTLQREAAESVEGIRGDVEKSTDRIVSAIDEIHKGFETLNAMGGIIASPSRPEEFYHNARIYELNGNYLNARQAYSSFFQFDLNFLDPHLRYQRFLIAQEGRAGARETYASLFKGSRNKTVELARILLLDREVRLARLRQYVVEYPDSAPCWYQLSLEYSAARLGVQSLENKQQEFEALETFFALHERGMLLKHFLDQEVVSEWLEDAAERLEGLRSTALLHAAAERLVSVEFSRIGETWIASLSLLEPAEEVYYRIGDIGDLVSTGHSGVVDPKTGKPMPKLGFQFDPEGRDFELFIYYRDINGEDQGPVVVYFDRIRELCRGLREDLAEWGLSVVIDHVAEIRFLELLMLPEEAAKVFYRWRWAADGPSRQVFMDAQSAYYASSAENWNKYYDKPENGKIAPLEEQTKYESAHRLALWNETRGVNVDVGWVCHPGGDDFLSDNRNLILEFYYLDSDSEKHGPFGMVPRGYAPFGHGLWGRDAISPVVRGEQESFPWLVVSPSEDMSDSGAIRLLSDGQLLRIKVAAGAKVLCDLDVEYDQGLRYSLPNAINDAISGQAIEMTCQYADGTRMRSFRTEMPDLLVFEHLCRLQNIHFRERKKADLKLGDEPWSTRWLVIDWLPHTRPKHELPAVPVYFDEVVESHGYGIARFLYGLDTEEPDRLFELPVEPAVGWTDESFQQAHTVYAPLSTELVTIRLVFLDGEESEVYRFHRFHDNRRVRPWRPAETGNTVIPPRPE